MFYNKSFTLLFHLKIGREMSDMIDDIIENAERDREINE